MAQNLFTGHKFDNLNQNSFEGKKGMKILKFKRVQSAHNPGGTLMSRASSTNNNNMFFDSISYSMRKGKKASIDPTFVNRSPGQFSMQYLESIYNSKPKTVRTTVKNARSNHNQLMFGGYEVDKHLGGQMSATTSGLIPTGGFYNNSNMFVNNSVQSLHNLQEE